MFNLWGEVSDEQILKKWEKAESMGRRAYIIRYGLLGFGLYMFALLSLFLYTEGGAYSYPTFLICLISGLISGWLSGVQGWKRINMNGKNIKYRKQIDSEEDEYAKEIKLALFN